MPLANLIPTYSFLIARARMIWTLAWGISLLAVPSLWALNPAEQALADLQSEDLAARYAALETMKTVRTADTVPALIASALSAQNPRYAVAVLDLLAESHRPKTLAGLRPLLTHTDAAVRRRAAQVVAILAGPDSESLLLPALASESDPRVLAAVVQGLGICGGPAAVEALEPFRAHANASVRTNASAALERLTGQRRE